MSLAVMVRASPLPSEVRTTSKYRPPAVRPSTKYRPQRPRRTLGWEAHTYSTSSGVTPCRAWRSGRSTWDFQYPPGTPALSLRRELDHLLEGGPVDPGHGGHGSHTDGA